MRRYKITKPTFRYHYNAVCQETGQEYFVDIRALPKRDAPHLTVYYGTDKSGTPAGYVHFPAFTNSWKVAFCDRRDPRLLEWEDVTSVKRCTTAKWRWPVTMPPRHAGGEPIRRVFIWTRTRHVGVDGKKPSRRTNRHWKLQEEGAEGYVAVFTGDPAKGRCGVLEIYEAFHDEFNDKLLVTLLGLYEMARSNGGGGGGSG
ncbi:hypothetical protein K4F52_006570 [Lecanicillium sp. MT-2017a]|nr:hypothetical protein K4F52_006570 [Lecanicillium sp. MT-2017a]